MTLVILVEFSDAGVELPLSTKGVETNDQQKTLDPTCQCEEPTLTIYLAVANHEKHEAENKGHKNGMEFHAFSRL